MITLYRPSGYDSPRASSFAGRSVDDKPFDVENGSSFKEIDTGRIFRYDKENNLWIEQKSTSGGGATEPYIEETYDTEGSLIGAKLYGYSFVRDNIYQNVTTLKTIEMPDDIYYIGNAAFGGCTNLTLTSLPRGLMSMGNGVFENCTNLTLTSLPESLMSIGHYAFSSCTNLALTTLSEDLTTIGNFAFADCTSLTSITFKGTPTTINSTAFNGCTNLTDIKVPWAEGAVANAPWGAKNATITYNYTE